MTATGQITFKSYLEAAGQIAFEIILGYLSGSRTNSKKWSAMLFVWRPDNSHCVKFNKATINVFQ